MRYQAENGTFVIAMHVKWSPNRVWSITKCLSNSFVETIADLKDMEAKDLKSELFLMMNHPLDKDRRCGNVSQKPPPALS